MQEHTIDRSRVIITQLFQNVTCNLNKQNTLLIYQLLYSLFIHICTCVYTHMYINIYVLSYFVILFYWGCAARKHNRAGYLLLF